MSLSTQTQHRLPYIKEGFLKGTNYGTIGQKCGVTERTIDRDVKTWIESGEFETWIKEEWLRLHHQTIHDNPELAYVQITKLVGHMLTRRIETKGMVYEKIEVTAPWLNLQSQATNTSRTVDKQNSTEAQPASES